MPDRYPAANLMLLVQRITTKQDIFITFGLLITYSIERNATICKDFSNCHVRKIFSESAIKGSFRMRKYRQSENCV